MFIPDNLGYTDKKTQDLVISSLRLTRKQLPWLIQLTEKDRQNIQSVGEHRKGFVEKVRIYADQDNDLFPSFKKKAEFERNWEMFLFLGKVMAELKPMFEMVDDTCMLTGAGSFGVSLAFYENVKSARKRNTPGTDVIWKALSVFFDRNGKIKPDPTEPKADSDSKSDPNPGPKLKEDDTSDDSKNDSGKAA